MKVSDYIVKFLIEKKVTDVFGYPGGMVTHLMDSLFKENKRINTHINYHEQASAIAACGYAQITHNIGVAFATSGPGATNLITGIANAYFDSIPTLFITGQVNTYENADGLNVRQKGFQETNIVSIVKTITKYAIRIDNPSDIPSQFEKAYSIAMSGRPGPVLLDIPMNVSQAEIYITEKQINKVKAESHSIKKTDIKQIQTLIAESNRPVIIAGNGINIGDSKDEFRRLVRHAQIPVITSMIAVDVLKSSDEMNYGFLGSYGSRGANIIVDNADLIISIGSRLDNRQVGNDARKFAPNARLIRFDIDKNELSNVVKKDELGLVCSTHEALSCLLTLNYLKHNQWINECEIIRKSLLDFDETKQNIDIKKISRKISSDSNICVDVGQNMIWAAQSIEIKESTRVVFSGGLGSMGYAIPSAIGAYYGNKKPTYVVCGDGGFQMNSQELNFISCNELPICIIVFNNNSLGMIRYFQKIYFKAKFAYTVPSGGYNSLNFKKIASAYGFQYTTNANVVKNIEVPTILEVKCNNFTVNQPKMIVGKSIYEVEPKLSKGIANVIKDVLKRVKNEKNKNSNTLL